MYNEFDEGKILRNFILIVITVIMLLIVLFRSFYSVDEQHNAVITQFGQIIDVKTAGFYLKPFWQSAKKVDITTHGTGIGYVIADDGETKIDEDNGIMITSDFNLLNIDFYLEYRVSDPVAYLYNSENAEGILENVALANIRTVVSNYTVDEAMTTGKGQIQADIKQAIAESLAEQNIGLSIINITIQDAAPPTAEIVSAFKAVETAKQGADTAKNNALKYQNEKLPEAEAKADAITQTAEAKKEARIAEAEGQAARFNEVYNEYVKYPLVTKRRMFYEKMESVLPGLKVIITDGGTQTMLPLDTFSNVNAEIKAAETTNETVKPAETPAE